MNDFPAQGERRQKPRVDLLTTFQGHLIALDEEVRVLQLGAGGMTIATAVPLQPSHVHDLQLTIDSQTITLKARVVHTRPTIDRDEFTYIAGVAFVDLSPEASRVITTFLSHDDGRARDHPAVG